MKLTPRCRLQKEEWDFNSVPVEMLPECAEFEYGRELARNVPQIAEAAERLRPLQVLPECHSLIDGFVWRMFGIIRDFPRKPWLSWWQATGSPEQKDLRERRQHWIDLATPPEYLQPCGFERGLLADLGGKDSRRINPIQLAFPDFALPKREANFPLEVFVARVDWGFPPEAIEKAFHAWLVAARPEAFRNRGGRPRQPSEMLAWLGAYRLLKAGHRELEAMAFLKQQGSEKTLSRTKRKVTEKLKAMQDNLGVCS